LDKIDLTETAHTCYFTFLLSNWQVLFVVHMHDTCTHTYDKKISLHSNPTHACKISRACMDHTKPHQTLVHR